MLFRSLADYSIDIDEQEILITCIGMGNPHAVVFVEDVINYPVEKIGSLIEKYSLFPKRTNVEFVQIDSRSELHMRVWERGSGETQACGTGACAAVAASILTNRTDNDVKVHLPGGIMWIQYDNYKDSIFMTGPAKEVYYGHM